MSAETLDDSDDGIFVCATVDAVVGAAEVATVVLLPPVLGGWVVTVTVSLHGVVGALLLADERVLVNDTCMAPPFGG